MKRFLLVLLTIGLLCSCKSKRTAEWEVTYRIHYPDTTITYTERFAGVEEGVKCSSISFRGSNYILASDDYHQPIKIAGSTAPLELVTYRKVE